MFGWLVCLAICGAPPPGAASAPLPKPPIEFVADDDPTRIVVRSVLVNTVSVNTVTTSTVVASAPGKPLVDKPLTEAEGRRLLTLRLVDEMGKPESLGPPLFGSYEIKNGAICFTPKFALGCGLTYRATRHRDAAESGGADEIFYAADYRVPEAKPSGPTGVASVRPAVDEVPANLLKFWIYFSQPMREGKEIFEHVHLLDADGKEIPHPWRDIELWTHDGNALTLYIHPGRIKQGVNLREELGPVLMPGRSYTLVIDGAMRDVTGAKIGKEYRKTFKTGPELHKKFDVASWKITAPKAGTLEPLVIEFDREFDYGSIYLSVFDQAGKSVTSSGRSRSPSPGIEREPNAPWKSGTYKIVVDPKTTDLAGNTPHTVFDRDLDDRSHDPTEGPIERTFTIR